jgi:hypothetical protein
MFKIYEIGKERYELVKKFEEYLTPIKKAAVQLLPDAVVYLFGSALTGKLVAASDIDILIVTEKSFTNQRERGAIVLGIEDSVGLPFVHPFEFHLMSKEEFKRFIDTTNTELKIL